jgi:ribosome-binding protein aMBF1 (putative translation factor)
MRSALGFSRFFGVAVSPYSNETQKAKKSMELADESVREVFGLKQSRARIVQFKNVELSTLGRRIRRARKLLGFSQKDFSMKCGLDKSYLGGVERGDRSIPDGQLRRRR